MDSEGVDAGDECYWVEIGGEGGVREAVERLLGQRRWGGVKRKAG